MKTETKISLEAGNCLVTERTISRCIETRPKMKALPRSGGFLCLMLLVYSCGGGEIATNSNASARLEAKPELRLPTRVWQDGIGSGFRKGTEEESVTVGMGLGMKVLGGSQSHNLVLGRLRYGRVLTEVVGGNSWLRGNLGWGLELVGGGQYQPKEAYLFGLTPTLRYSFATGSRWMPFVDGGAGVSLTDIGHPDLSTKFEFNLQVGAGCNYFLKDNLALTLQYRFLHLSNARIDTPNLGVNTSIIYLGLTRYF